LRGATRLIIYAFAALGALIAIVGAGSLFLKRGDPPDQTRVVAVVPNPAGTEAAVVYLHDVANFSTKVLAVQLERPPFPGIGSAVEPSDSLIMAVRHPRVSEWNSSSANPETDPAFGRLVDITWDGDHVDVCPADGATLLRYDSQDFGDDSEHVTLCRKRTR
jgi:hypothetical protein